MERKQIYTLDYLRGLLAFSVMLYHYTLDTYIPMKSILERLGFYSVSIFYVLSGLTLFIVYRNTDFTHIGSIKDFFRKRILRIFPLFIAVTTLIFIFFRRDEVVTYLLNITGIFSIISWDKYLITGGWSIGNEISFYLTFPIFIWAIQRKKWLFFLLVGFSFLVSIYITFYMITPSLTLAENWRNYANPLNQHILFALGIMIGYFVYDAKVELKYANILLIIGGGSLLFLPVSGKSVWLVYGINRIFFIISCIMLVVGFFKSKSQWGIFHRPLSILGEISYGLYLIHPVVMLLLSKFFMKSILLSIIISLIVSYISYHYFEKKFLKRKSKV